MVFVADVEETLEERRWHTEHLRWLLTDIKGPERIQALQACREAGIGATELAKLAGISRARLYQLLEKADAPRT